MPRPKNIDLTTGKERPMPPKPPNPPKGGSGMSDARSDSRGDG